MNSDHKQRSIIVELAGPPGAGKSTFAEVLLKLNSNTVKVNFPAFSQTKICSFFYTEYDIVHSKFSLKYIGITANRC